jgi:hypothetical protein
MTTLQDLLARNPLSRALYEAVRAAVAEGGPYEEIVQKSQVHFRARRAFAWVWIPEQYLRRPAAPLVLTVALPTRDPSPRWKEVVEPAPGRFIHHLELRQMDDVDEEVRAWLRSARAAAE